MKVFHLSQELYKMVASFSIFLALFIDKVNDILVLKISDRAITFSSSYGPFQLGALVEKF